MAVPTGSEPISILVRFENDFKKKNGQRAYRVKVNPSTGIEATLLVVAPFGLTSTPTKNTQLLSIPLGGNNSKGRGPFVAVGVIQDMLDPAVQEGETMLYAINGAHIYLNKHGNIAINGQGDAPLTYNAFKILWDALIGYVNGHTHEGHWVPPSVKITSDISKAKAKTITFPEGG